MIVVGSANSSNSVRLVEVALEAGAKAAYRVDNATEVDLAWLEGVTSVGVTSGASVPDDLVQGVLELLVEQGYPAAREERLTEESLIFALPPELRRGLKRNGQGRLNLTDGHRTDLPELQPCSRTRAENHGAASDLPVCR